MIDIAIRGGWLVDGSGGARRRADVGIVGDKVAVIGQVGDAAREVDATGRIVAPGFVDPHSHSDWTVHANREAQSTIRQGVTTEVVGNCGITVAPVSSASLGAVAARLVGYDGPVSWRSFGEYLADVESGGTSQNLAYFVGHSTIREAAGVADGETPDDDTMAVMEGLVAEAMEAGALGMSTGLEYSHGAFAATHEVQQLARIAGRYAGMYASHIRNRDSRIFDAITEFLDIIRDGNTGGQISHLNVRHDTNAPDHAWERAVQMMEDARSQGVDIQADTTPFLEGPGLMTAILPPWLMSEGPDKVAVALSDPLVRDRLRGDCDRYWRFIHKGQWERVRLQSSAEFPELDGLTFTEIARRRQQDPWESYFDILQAAGAEMDSLVIIGRLFTEEHSAEMVSHPLFSLGVDTWTSDAHGPLSAITRSPQPYSGHVHYLTHHVRERGTLTLEQAIHKMSAKPASRFRLRGRGLVREGYQADLVVFDFDGLRSDSTFDTPAVYPHGIDLVMVNGEVVVDGPSHTGARPGKVLRRGE